MKKITFFLFFSCMLPLFALSQGNEKTALITRPSAHSMEQTLDLLKGALDEMGLTLIAEIDHAAAAAKNGLELRPTHTLIFGNPQVGTRLMQADQRAGLDLPLRLLIWQQEGGKVFISHHSPLQLAETYRLKQQTEVLEKMQGVFEKLTQKVR
jgi:uncharacterized protein (DUF302 family)